MAFAQWERAKLQQGIQKNQKVLLDVEEWRREEITHANEALARRNGRDGPIARELRSSAHDVVEDGHDRDYRGIAAYPHYILKTNQANVRVSDLRIIESRGYELRSRYFQTPGGWGWPTIEILAPKHHMRRMETCDDILSPAKREWCDIPNPHLQAFSVYGPDDTCRLELNEVDSVDLRHCRFCQLMIKQRCPQKVHTVGSCERAQSVAIQKKPTWIGIQEGRKMAIPLY